ncbi:alpha/beta fold hydrolase [Stygiolobus azoricus]|uniref:Alpha/beta fold hydrolase n=1 Tax=Stygiolobus azoricus TaxID=41675 RepID=A0A650CPN8_9CREN|nr:alpha/beta hydrolase [Stygiolobus azoricus]QGR19810.1 hypothetical protein D1868_07345 [Stygiolobus azoricus]
MGKYVEVKSIKIYYEKIGNGKPIVMIHPSGFDDRFYHKLLIFITRDITNIIVDLSGHGKSDADPNQLSGKENAKVEFYGDYIIQSIKNLGLTKFSVLGMSLGGDIALAVGMRGNAENIIMISSSINTRSTFIEKDIENSSNSNPQTIICFAGPNADKKLVEELTWIRSANSLEILRWDLYAWDNFDYTKKLEREINTLIIRREYEQLVSKKMIEDACKYVNACKSLEFNGFGHYVLAEDPKNTVRELGKIHIKLKFILGISILLRQYF